MLLPFERCVDFSGGQSAGTGSGASSSHAASETDAGSHLSTVVYPTGANSMASSSHSNAQASDAAAATGLASRLGQGQAAAALTKAGTGHAADSAASVSNAAQGQRGILVVSGEKGAASDGNSNQGFIIQQSSTEHEQSGVNNQDTAHSVRFAVARPVADGAAMGQSAGAVDGSSCAVGFEHSQASSATVAQPPRSSAAGSEQSASGVALSAAGTADESAHPSSATGFSSQGINSSGLSEDAPGLSQMLSGPEQVTVEAVAAQPQGQSQAALPGAEAEQRNLEEQEVLYNMTGQTGSLMYMAPEVSTCGHAC